MKTIHLHTKWNHRGWPICNFPDCYNKVVPQDYHSYRLCWTHYHTMISLKSGCYVPMCEHEDCYKIHGLQSHNRKILCKKHYHERVKMYQKDHACDNIKCTRRAVDEFSGKYYCARHLHKIKLQTYYKTCNYVDCNHSATVRGFNSQWCDKHYSEMSHIRKNITHDESSNDLKFRLKELQVRKDSNTKTGNFHRWYYLQAFSRAMTK